jgi:serine/threonine-protein kinase
MSIEIERLTRALEGRYVVEKKLGEGGMATVFLAEDLKHKRKVALKVLKPELAAVVGAERFLTEIETTANLQHPHILPLFDSGEADSFLFYVMPYVEGESLHDRLERERQLPVDDAVRIASDMAEALDYAHRHGVVHRDIKPGNVLMHEGRPLIADFGIAIAVGAAGGTRLTETGLSVGTPFYMSPEQATGDQAIGAASDLYSLACVLYEMLVGEPPYVGATAQAVLGKIISGGPVSATTQRRSIPAHVDAAIRRALEKLPADRFPTARGFAEALSDPAFRHGASSGAAVVTRTWNRVSIGATAAAVAFAAAFAWSVTRPVVPTPLTRLAVQMPDGQRPLGDMTFDISADGRVIAYQGPGSTDGSTGLWIRRLDQLDGEAIQNSDFARAPALSPDGTQLAFDLEGPGLRVVSLAGGGGRFLAEEVNSILTWRLRWGPGSEWIYFDAFDATLRERSLYRVRAAGGSPERVVTIDEADPIGSSHFFDVLPSGEAVVVEHTDLDGEYISAVDFVTGASTRLISGAFPRYANGYLLYRSPDGIALMAVPFDPDRLELTGDPMTVAEGLPESGFGWSHFAASQTGTLLYLAGNVVAPQYEIVRVDRNGNSSSVDPDFVFDPGSNNRGLAVSADGTRVALTTFEDGNYDIWVKDLPRGPRTRISFQDGWDVRPRWTPDGRVMYQAMFGGTNQDMRIVAKNAAGTGEPDELMDHDLPLYEAAYTPDGSWLIGRTGGQTTAPGGRDVWAIETGVDTVPHNLLVTPFDEKAIGFSPDGRWLLYESDETGQNEIYVRPFPNVNDDKVTVSIGGGVMPLWSRGGGEIFYIDADQQFVAATVETGDRLRVTERETLFPIPTGMLFRVGEQYTLYDSAPDDQSFYLFVSVSGEEAPRTLTYVQSWTEGLPGR